jgi:hypothetical protein
MCGPPDPDMRKGALGGSAPNSQGSYQQQPTYTIGPDVQVLVAVLLPQAVPLLCLFAAWVCR